MEPKPTKTCNTCDWGYKKWFFSTPVCNHPTVIEAFDPVDGKPVPCQRARSAKNYSPCGQHALCYQGPAVIGPVVDNGGKSTNLTNGMITASMASPFWGSNQTVSLAPQLFVSSAIGYSNIANLTSVNVGGPYFHRPDEESSSDSDGGVSLGGGGGGGESWSGGGGGFSGGGATGDW